MHEFGIAEELAVLVDRTLTENHGAKVLKVVVEAGAGAIEEVSLRAAFEEAARGGAMDGAELVIETAPREFHCFDCGTVFPEKEGRISACPVCGGSNIISAPNHDVILKSVEIEG
ncbi:MAG: hydrogenase maturation nickel metallochaperone HypA [Actinomycetota bacterium]|nr:hydrogenase maturation nickel metallochaperone HypA [Actinomycetota bacterium]